MLKELSERLSKVIEQRRLKNKLEQDLHVVKKALNEKSARFTALCTQLEKEKVDVDKLERMSLTALFYSVLGSREQQLEKERQELLSAQLAYHQTKHQMEFLGQEQNSLLKQLETLAGVEAEYELLLSEKELLLRESNQAVANQLMEFAEQMANLNAEVKEITEAIAAGNSVVLELGEVIKSLESAENWGTWDMLGGGLISTAIKHSRIDDARSGIDNVQAKMSRFKRELADIQKSIELQINIGELAIFADFFFDGLITDWIVQSKIVDSLERSITAKKKIFQVVKELEGLKKIAQSKTDQIKEKRVLLLEHA